MYGGPTTFVVTIGRRSSYGKNPMQHSIPTVTDSLRGFIDYMTVERRLSPRTIQSYSEGVGYFARQVGDLPIEGIQLNHLARLCSGCAAYPGSGHDRY